MWKWASDNEVRAESNFHKEAAARREADDEYAMLRTTLGASILNSSPFFYATDANLIREEMLRESDSALGQLLARKPKDTELHGLRARVLVQLGAVYFSQNRNEESGCAFEQAAAHWDQLPDTERQKLQNRFWRMAAYFGLEQVFERIGHDERAQHCFEIAIRIWQQMIMDDADWNGREELLPAAVNVKWLIVGRGLDWGNVSQRFESIRKRLDRMGAKEEGEWFFGLLRLSYLSHQGRMHLESGAKDNFLAVAREKSTILSSTFLCSSLHRNYRVQIVSLSFQVCQWMRRAGVAEEVLPLATLVNRTLEDLLRETPVDPSLLFYLSSSWHEIGKIHADCQRVEDSLSASRNAIAVQRRLFGIASSEANRNLLGSRFMQLGRKLCILGRLDEAEVCFSDRQALWPGDAGKQKDALRELRKWADEVGGGSNNLSPLEQQQRQRYLELCTSFERKGVEKLQSEIKH